MGILIKNKSGYRNTNAAYNTIHYITRTRKEESRADQLLCWGAYGASTNDADQAARSFGYVKNTYKKRYGTYGGCNVVHYFYHPNTELSQILCKQPEAVRQLGNLNAREFYSMGYQVVWAAHYNEHQSLHYHMVVNSYPCRRNLGKYRPTKDIGYELTEIFDKNASYISKAYCSAETAA